MGDQRPRFGAADGCLTVLGQAAASAERGEGPFNYPPARQNVETLSGIGPPYDLDPPVALASQNVAQRRPGVAAVVEHMGAANPKRVERSHQVVLPFGCKTGWSRQWLGLRPLAGIMRGGRRYSSDLTDREWRVVAPLLPGPRRLGRPRSTGLRDVVNAINTLPRLAASGA